MNYVLWFVIALSIVLLGFGYIGWRIIHSSHLERPWNTAAWVLLTCLALLIPLAFMTRMNWAGSWVSTAFIWIAYINMGFFSLVLTFLLIRDFGWLLFAGGEKLFSFAVDLFQSGEKVAAHSDPERRRFLIRSMSVGILTVAGGMTAYGLFQARRRPGVVDVSIPIPNLHDDLVGLRIVQITDIHAGLTVGKSFVETIVEQANELKADIIAFTGDLVDGSVKNLRDAVAPMQNLQARYGKYFITGNHEYYSGAAPWVEEAQRLGFTVLLNEHDVLKLGNAQLLLAGVTDYSGGNFLASHKSDPAKAVMNAPECDAKILLAHQPKTLHSALPLNFDLQISGHTHGGQFFPWNLVAAIDQPYISGLHKHEHMWVYVSRGTGYWGPPVRIAARSEITVLTLVRA
jgi:predicted MPP superfamily phosphohydrolase